jgi:Mn2+/Fe2+ NRAMP family transporter
MSESSPTNEHIQQQAQELEAAEAQGLGATLKTYTKYSGPGWVQSAITLGGGSLSGALFLGILGGTSLLWLQLVAIIMGVIMLSAISYITLSTGKKPFQAINEHINPALGWGWLIATIAANMHAAVQSLFCRITDESDPRCHR